MMALLLVLCGLVLWWDLRRTQTRQTADLTALRAALAALAAAQGQLVTTVRALPAPAPPPSLVPLEAAVRALAVTVEQYREAWEQRHDAQQTRLGEWVDGLHTALRSLQARVLESVGQAREAVGNQVEAHHSDLVTFREEVIRLANRPLPPPAALPTPPSPKTPDFPPALLAAAQERGVSPERLRDMMLEALGL
jgi:hypothetical protein